MQREYKINKKHYLVKFKDKYYVANSYTKKFIETINSCSNEIEFAEKFKVKPKKALKLMNKFYDKIENCDYYDYNVSLPTPMKVQWKITNKCNLKCKHCYLGDLNNACLSEDDLMKIATNIVNSQVMEVTITGGEALTVPNIYDIIQLFISNGIVVSVYTNAILLGKFLDQCVNIDRKMLKFLVSLDGDKEAHENIRGKNTFDVTLNNIKKTIELGFDLTVNCVANKVNYLTIPNMLVKLVESKVFKVQLSNLILMGNAGKDLILTTKDKQDLHNSIVEKMQSIGNPPILIFLSNSEFDDESNDKTIYRHDLPNDELQNLGHEKWVCAAGISRVTINHKGDVMCCPFMEKNTLGNILNSSIDEIWASKNRYVFLKKIQESNSSRKCIAMESNYGN